MQLVAMKSVPKVVKKTTKINLATKNPDRTQSEMCDDLYFKCDPGYQWCITKGEMLPELQRSA